MLRLIMLHDKRYYIFIDSAKGQAQILRETAIPLHKDNKGSLNLDDDEVKSLLKKQFKEENLKVYSFWTT